MPRVCLGSQSLLNDQAPHPVSTADPSHLSGEAHQHCYLRSYFFCHHPQLVTKGEASIVHRPVHQQLQLHSQLLE